MKQGDEDGSISQRNSKSDVTDLVSDNTDAELVSSDKLVFNKNFYKCKKEVSSRTSLSNDILTLTYRFFLSKQFDSFIQDWSVQRDGVHIDDAAGDAHWRSDQNSKIVRSRTREFFVFLLLQFN